jgi:HTH-type transcriptional regulator / antitoxin HigA
MFSLKPIRTDVDHRQALAEVDRLWGAEPGSPEHDRLEALAILISDFEEKSVPLPGGDAVDAVRFHMEQNGLTDQDLASILGSRERARAFLAGKRELTLDMIRRLRRQWRIPADALIQGRRSRRSAA